MSKNPYDFKESSMPKNRYAQAINATKKPNNLPILETAVTSNIIEQDKIKDAITTEHNSKPSDESKIDNIPNNNMESNEDINDEASTKSILNKVLQKDKNKGRNGLNHSLYLSKEVSDMINKLAKKSGKSKSTLVDEILKEVFFND